MDESVEAALMRAGLQIYALQGEVAALRQKARETGAAGLSRTELHQLLDYAQHCEGEGWYWGNAAQFRKRHKRIKAWLNAQIDACDA